MAYSSSSSGGAGAGNPASFTMLEVQVQTTRDSVTRLFNQSDYIRISLIQNVAGVRTVLDTKVFNSTNWPGPFSTQQKPLVRDNYDGTDPATDYITVETNGIEVCRLSPTNSNIANTSGLDYSGAFTGRVGLVFNGNSDGTGKPCRALGGRLVDPPAQGAQAPGVGRPDFVAFGENAVWSGVMGEDQLLQPFTQANHDVTNLETGQVGLFGRYVSAMTKIITFDDESGNAVTRNRILATDGREADGHCHVTIDPIERKVAEWNIEGGGAVPDLLGFELCCNHGPGVLIAAMPGNKSMYALSAKVDKAGPVYYWQNFNPSDAGITTTTDRAVIGSASGQGLPADDIIALVPVPNEDARYETLFMCSRSIWSLKGDPRVDGGLTNVSSSTGIFGPQSWCFDNKGNLWWIGNGGLHAMPKGTRTYTKTDGRRLPAYFELADVFRRQVLLRYRASDNTILCYLTPRVGGPDEGQPALVAVYDIEAQEFTKDEYDGDVGPTAAVELTGQKPEDRDVALCGLDGFVYRYSDSAYSDNGEPIDVVMDFVSSEEMGGEVTSLMDLIDVEAATGTGAVDLSIYTANSPVEARDFNIGQYVGGVLTNEDTPYIESVLFQNKSGGRERVADRAAGVAYRFVLRQRSASETVVIERLRARFAPVGEAR